MNKELLATLKQKLETESASVQKELESFASKDEHIKDNWKTTFPNREDSDKEEKADEFQDYDNMLSLEYNLETKLKDIHSALEKMEKGEYGACEKCGKPIEEARLEIMPEGRMCIGCNK